MLEDKVNGPLYKIVMNGPKPSGLVKRLLWPFVGPAPVSVSKVNQVISLVVTLIWVMLLKRSLPPFDSRLPIDWHYVTLCTMTAATCVAFVAACRSDETEPKSWATERVPD